jgi:membrane protein
LKKYAGYQVLKDFYLRFQEHEVPALGAQLTYYLLLAFFPFLIFLLTLLSYTTITSEQVLYDLSRILPRDAFKVVQEVVRQTLNTNRQTLLSLGALFTIWASSNGVNAVIHGINKSYGEKENRPFWKVRGMAIFFTIGLTLVIIMAFVLLVLGKLLGQTLFAGTGNTDLFVKSWQIYRFSIPLVVMLIVFMFFYRYAPNKKTTFRETIPGALFSSLGWVFTSLAFSFYVNQFSNFTRTYGSLGGIIILLLWLYLSSIIILIGGEINATLARREKTTNP